MNTTTGPASNGTSMRAVTRHRYGSADQLAIEQLARPTPGPDEVLVEVVAAGLDRGVWHLMTGLPYLVRIAGFGLRRPKNPVLGSDVSGRVVEVGANVDDFAPGDEVMGIADGSFAEYALADPAKLVAKPAEITFEQAAVATVSGTTALQALTTVGRLESGQRVLVVGASGGVGSFAVQIARALGGEVTAVAGPASLDLLRELGATHVVDYTQTGIDEVRGGGFDLIVDIGGRNPISALRRVLTERGTLVLVGGEGGDRLTGGMGRTLAGVARSPFVKQRIAFFIGEESRRYIEPLAELLAAGDVTPAIGRRVPLDDVRPVMRDLESGAAKGKTVITLDQAG